MKIVGWLLFFVFNAGALTAQYDRILHNPDVTWAAEIDVVYALQPPQLTDSVQLNDIIFWKNYDPRNPAPWEGGELLIEKILTAARSGAWPAWLLGDTPRQLSADEVAAQLGSRDTVEVMDVETGVTHQKVVTNDPDLTSFFGIRAKQLLYYDTKKGEFELYTSAIAPVRHFSRSVQDRHGVWQDVYLFDYVPFWLKMPEFSKKEKRKQPDLNDPNILWAAQIKTLGNTPDVEKLRPMKDFDPPVMQDLLDRFHTDRHFAAYDALGEPIDFADRKAMLFTTDSVLTFDPETYEEKLVVVKNEIRAADVYRLRLVEDWFWDERKGRLVIRLHSVAPMIDQFDDMGNFRAERGLFYCRKR